MVSTSKNSVEETSKTTSVVDFTLLDKEIQESTFFENNRINTINDAPPQVADEVANKKRFCSDYIKVKVYCIFLSIAILLVGCVIIVVCFGLFKKDCCMDSIRTKTVEDTKEVPYVTSINDTTPSILLFLNKTDKKEMEKHSKTVYNVSWQLGSQGFQQGNIRFNNTDIYIDQTGIYLISVYLQMDYNIKPKNENTFCNLLLTTVKGLTTKSIFNKNSIPKVPDDDRYRFLMSLTLTYKLQKGQKLYVSISPINYLSIDDDSSFLSIHMMRPYPDF